MTRSGASLGIRHLNFLSFNRQLECFFCLSVYVKNVSVMPKGVCIPPTFLA